MPPEGQSTFTAKPQTNYTALAVSLVVLVFLAVMAYAASFSPDRNAVNNPFGDQTAQLSDPTDPAVAALIDRLSAYAEPKTVLSQPERLNGFRNALEELKKRLEEPNPEKVSSNPARALEIVNQLLEKTAKIQEELTAKKKEDLELRNEFTTLHKELSTLVPAGGGAAPAPKGGFAYPVKPEDIISIGTSAHGRSVEHPDKKDSHNTIINSINNYWSLNLNGSKVGAASDINTATGRQTPVYAPFSGTVKNHEGRFCVKGSDVEKFDNATGNCALSPAGTCSGDANFYGTYVILVSDDGQTMAAMLHLKNLKVRAGAKVTAGQLLADDVCTRTKHLHFELWREGKPVTSQTYDSTGSTGMRIWRNQQRAMGLEVKS